MTKKKKRTWLIRAINLPYNQITGRRRKPLVLPRDFKIPTAEVTLKVELIEEYRVLKKFYVEDKWCFIVVDEYDSVHLISFDDEGNAYDVSAPPLVVHDIGPSGVPKQYHKENGEENTDLV